MRDFRELKVWEKAHRLTLQVYRITKNFPSDEQFGLTVQLRRAAASVPTNIAEGCGRDSERELNQQINEIKRMLNTFIQKLTANS